MTVTPTEYPHPERYVQNYWILVPIAMLVFFTVSTVLAQRSVQIMSANAVSISHTLQVINLIKDLKTELVNAETGSRGFFITKDPQYLAPYHQASMAIDNLLDSLGKTYATNPQHTEAFTQLTRAIKKKMVYMQGVVDTMERDEADIAAAQIRNNTGFRLMEDIRILLKDIEVDEFEVLKQKQDESAANRSFIMWAFFAVNFFGLVLTLGIFVTVFRVSTKLASLNAQIEQANTELEGKVESRTHMLTQYSDELQRSNRELEEFAFVASHDLQEPLRKIRAFGDRLQQKYMAELGERGADYIVRMQAASERMSILINDLLSFSRVTTKQKPFARTDLNAVVSRVCNDLDYAIEEASAEVKVGPLPVIDADASQLGQVFFNLLGNSLKFRRPDVSPVITIDCAMDLPAPHSEDDRKWCRLRFADNGIGFDEQYVERVFNLFQRLHGRDEYPGTGIGLALCRKIIERHGGNIQADGGHGNGAVFTIFLPQTQYASELTDKEQIDRELFEKEMSEKTKTMQREYH